jgi:hypothetical protein
MTSAVRITIEGADEHPHAGRRLGDRVLGDSPGRLVGAAAIRIRLQTDESLVEGAYVVEGAEGVIVVRGGPVSGVVQGVERVIREIGAVDDDRPDMEVIAAELAKTPWSDAPVLPYRPLWTWDHSTDWLLDAVGAQDTGAFNPYNRQPGSFLGDYERLVDFASRVGINAVVVYGLLRDSHGGVESAQRLCRFGADRGVRIIAGIGINAYGGIYWEGEHRFNLATWLRAHTELAARSRQALGFSIPDYGELAFPRSDYLAVACPSRAENVRFHEDAIAWLVDTLDVGGVLFEAGDYGGCSCEVCESERGSPDRIARLAERYDRLFDRVASSSGTVPRWSIYEVYTDNLLDTQVRASVGALPDSAAFQYTVNRSYWPRVREAVEADAFGLLPHSQNILRTHMGSQWNRQRHAWVGATFAEMAGVVARTGMTGLSVFGEASAYHPPNELNYAAFARYAWDPQLAWERFEQEEVEPRLGGHELAARFLALLGRLGEDRDGADVDSGLAAACAEAREVGRSLSGEVGRRWLWLEERLARRRYALHNHGRTRLGDRSLPGAMER